MTAQNGKSYESCLTGRLRQQAETLLGASLQDYSKMSPGDARTLVHELRVHQVELEMQNQELRRIQIDLENSRDRFAWLYDLAPVGYLTLDARGVIHEANLTAARLLGLERATLLKQKLSRFVAAESQDDLYLHCRQVFATTDRQSCALRMRQTGGTVFCAQLESIAAIPEEIQPGQCLVALTDITKRKQAEELRAQLAAIVDSSEDAIIGCTLDNVITSWNQASERLFGYSAQEMVGRSVALLVPPERMAELCQVRREILQGRPVEQFETLRKAKDGRNIDVITTVSPIRDGDGKIIGISSMLRDLTFQKRTEAAAKRNAQTLADFFAEAPIGLLWVGADGMILRMNQAQAAMLERQGEEFFGRQWLDYCADPAEVKEMLKLLAEKQPLLNHRLKLLRKDGSHLHVLIDANGFWENGKLVHSSWFVRDVTQRMELQKEILAVGERVQRRIGQDLHDDLCQQLTGIEFLARSLERQLGEQGRAPATRAGEIAKLTRQAITHARELAHGMAPMDLATDGVAESLKNLTVRVKKLFNIDCRFRCDANGHDLRGAVEDLDNRIHLYRIAQEAVNNAIKHGKARRIDVRLARDRDNLVLTVQNNGASLPPNPLLKGAGLRIMEHRASTIGGTLALRSRKQGGAVLIYTIPRTPFKTTRRKKR